MTWDARAAALIADDHEVFRVALATILERHCSVQSILHAASFDAAVRALKSTPQVALATFDLAMPGLVSPMDLRELRLAFPHVRIVVISASQRREDMLSAISAGAHGFIPKTLDTQSIAAALRTVLSGSIFLPCSVADVTSSVAVETGDVGVQSSTRLTARQIDVLRLIRMGKSNKEIARALGLTESTVKVHTNALYRALGVRNRVGAASIATSTMS